MKRTILLLWLLLTASASAQFMPFGFWKSSATVFTPLSIDTASIWYAASAITGKGNGDTLYRLPNLSALGSSHDAYQLTASAKPVYITNAVNGLPAVRFDGVNDVMSTGNVSGPTDYRAADIFVVMRQNSAMVNEMFAWLASGGQNDNQISAYLSYLGTTLYFDHGSETSGSGRINVGVPTAWAGRWQLVELRRKADTMQIYTGDTLRVSAAGKTAGYAAATSQPLHIGARFNVGNWSGDLAEMIVYRNAISFTDRARVVAYLKQKYNIP